jgi:hypothetical protein
MTDIEAKALALVNEIEREEGATELTPGIMRLLVMDEALCRAIEQHEAFKQEVSDVMMYINALYPTLPRNFDRFIIPKPKPDPLVEAMLAIGVIPDANHLRAALDVLGFEIREKGQ